MTKENAMTTQPLGSEIEIAYEDANNENLTPGEDFARAVAARTDEDEVVVPFQAYLPASFPLLKTRPRYMVRHLLKVGRVRDGNGAYLEEFTHTDRGPSGTAYQATPESTFGSELRTARFTDVEMTLNVPVDFVRKPGLLASFIDYRMFVRMWTRENEILLYGSKDGHVEGLMNMKGLRRQTGSGDIHRELSLAACEVEETGGSCDGVVVHPELYWLAAESGFLDRFRNAGVTVSRTRMMPRGKALLADFRAGATLLNPGVSTLTLSRDPKAPDRRVITARTRLGLAVHVPQHFLLYSHEG
ncbi:family 3 encapsulin nanocompartment shell protein [Streptomyces buecherae]|uniref:family 3 encapsulin nanocompartment shell protein n=1 Tax=Streptomyces buecherae TaxID=2763006 RepID=UPI001E4357F7|nr:family 3 encapsulin nanocompartment shell protein [Streptomyces buecherae]